MNNEKLKEKYTNYAKKTFNGKALELVIHNINTFYSETKSINKKKYRIGDEVKLDKGTFLHGIPGLLDNFDWVVENGFISNDFTQNNTNNKIKNSIGMWVIKDTCLLKDYIKIYSGFTITYTIGRGPDSKEISKLIPYHKFDEFNENINNDDDVWMYFGEQTKEVRFIPSLVSNKRQIAFILNMESEYAKELSKLDIWNVALDEEILRDFIDYRYYEKFLKERFNRNASTTDREASIIFGLPSSLIEGVLVGRIVENNLEYLNHIKSKLPNCYICNLDGKIIVE